MISDSPFQAHINNAVKAGATREEIAEVVFIAAAPSEKELQAMRLSRKRAFDT
jgi:alkylhydroperoxidase/carboxymuconolactone decarboxylase family protein YurZ